MSDFGSWDNVLTIGHRKEREFWQAPAEIVAALSMKHDPVIAGRSILNHCWPDQNKDPEAPFVCASIAAGIVNTALSYSDSERREMWRIIERLLRQEEKSAIEAWEDRLILKYLQIRGLLPP
jgi:hypothetical protein